MYLLWSYLPSPFLHALGIYYYPNRWWSLAIPSFLVMLIVYIYVALAAYNTGTLTLPMSSIETIIDEAANVALLTGGGSMASSFAADQKKGRGGGGGRGRAEATTPNLSVSGQAERRKWRGIWNVGTDAVMDVPLGGVCEVLYGEERDEDIWDTGSEVEDEAATNQGGAL